jgi:hypothetical protein
MSDADRVGLAYVVESTFGVTPSGPPTLQDLRFTGESLKQETGTVSSTEIRSDRQVVDVIRTNRNAAGDINLELSYGAYDDFLAAALADSAWSSPATVGPGVTFAAVNSTNSFTDSANGLGSLNVGQWIRVSGFTETANNGYFKILTVTAGEITVSGGTLTDESAGDSVTIVEGAQIVNGTTLNSYAIEKVFNDVANAFAVYNGMTIDTMSLDIQPDQIITGSFGFIGTGETDANATAGDGSNTAATTNDIMNAVDHVNAVLEAAASFQVTQFNMTLSNNLRQRLVVGTLGAISMGAGKIAVTGTLQAYFSDQAAYAKYLNMTATDLAVIFVDAGGNAYVIELPQIKFTDGARVAGSENTDVIMDMAFTAYRDATEDTTIRIVRWPA